MKKVVFLTFFCSLINFSTALSRQPELSVSSRNFPLADCNAEGEITIKNTGDGQLRWQVASGFPAWIIVDDDGADKSLGGGKEATIKITANCENLQPGEEEGDLTIEQTNGDASKTVTIAVKIPSLEVTPLSLTFDEGMFDPTTKAIKIRNDGGEGTLKWSHDAPSRNWITVKSAPSKKEVQKGDEQTVTVSVNPGSLPKGRKDGTLTFRALNSNGAEETVSITMNIPNHAPKLERAFPDIPDFKKIDQGKPKSTIDLNLHFGDQDNDKLEFAATLTPAQNENISIEIGADDILILTPLKKGGGASTITVEADDNDGGKTSSDFTVTVVNSQPTLKREFGKIAFTRAQGKENIKLTDFIEDKDEDELDFIFAMFDNSGVESPSVYDAEVTESDDLILTAIAKGNTVRATIEAKDGEDFEDFPVDIQILNSPPSVDPNNRLRDRTLLLGEIFVLNLEGNSPVFSDADTDVSDLYSYARDTLLYANTSSDTSIASAFSVINDTINIPNALFVQAKDSGQATITVVAIDDNGEQARDDFTVKIGLNRPPVLITENKIDDQVLTVGGPDFSMNLTENHVFVDPDTADNLTYSVESLDPSIAFALIDSGDVLKAFLTTPDSIGDATSIIVNVEDGFGGSASDIFSVKVNFPPRVKAEAPRSLLLQTSEESTLDLNAVFFDPEEQALNFPDTIWTPTHLEISKTANLVNFKGQSLGSDTIRFIADDGVEGGVGVFDLIVNVDEPPMISSAPPVGAIDDSSIVLTAQISDRGSSEAVAGIETAILNFRRGGDSSFFSIQMDPADLADNFQVNLPAFAVTSRGVEYTIEARDLAGITAINPEHGFQSIRVRVGGEGAIAANPQPAGKDTTQYRLVSFPLELDRPAPADVLADDLDPYKNYLWRFLLPHADGFSFTDFPDIERVTPGQAYWIIVKNKDKVIDTGSGVSIPTDKPFEIDIAPGLNFVGTPFTFPTNIADTLASGAQTPVLYHYESKWSDPLTDPVERMEPFEGYCLVSNNSAADVLFLTSDTTSPRRFLTKQAMLAENRIEWSIRIVAASGNAVDDNNHAGIWPSGKFDWDERDYPEPPVIGGYVSVYFPHPEWGRLSKKYTTDFRPTLEDGEVWEFEVLSNIRDAVRLSFEGVEDAPEAYDVFLLDDAVKTPIDLRERNTYSIAGRGPEHPKRLKLLVAKGAFLDETLTDFQAVPETFELAQNYPNPFNPSTTIRYGLPQPARVTIRIYSPVGELVRTLIDGEEHAAGYHTAIWDGRNASGLSVASGVYLYMMHAGAFREVKKMALVK